MNDHVAQIPELPDLPHPLGRHVAHDLRAANFRALVNPPPRSVTPYKVWNTMTVFDQGNTSRCTCEAAIGMLRTTPFASQFKERPEYDTADERQSLYKQAQAVDPWPGDDYDGTSTDAPFRILRDAGVIGGWRWLFGERELREWVTWYGPVVAGTEWRMQMFYPDSSGFLTAIGQVAGGHAYRVVQYSRTRDAYRIVNSWGREWGDNGRAWIRSSDMADLLAQDGDVLTL